MSSDQPKKTNIKTKYNIIFSLVGIVAMVSAVVFSIWEDMQTNKYKYANTYVSKSEPLSKGTLDKDIIELNNKILYLKNRIKYLEKKCPK